MLLMSGKIGGGTIYELDTYNQQVHEDVACTILININTANHHFIFERMGKINNVGQISSSQNSRVIDPNGISYAITNGEKDGTPKIIEPLSCAMRGRNPDNPSERGRSNGKYKQRIEMGSNISNTITSVQKDALVAEPQVLTPKRTDFGKQVRKQYEQGKLGISRHDMTKLEPRSDGVSNTITSVQKDNYVAEPVVWEKVADELKQIATQSRGEQIEVAISEKGSLRAHRMDKSKSGCSEFQVENDNDISSTLISARPNMTYGISTDYRIRKLTERECFRLMGVSEADIDKIQLSGVSRTQQYKMAGNSIVVDVLYHIFRKMFVDTGQESQQLSLF